MIRLPLSQTGHADKFGDVPRPMTGFFASLTPEQKKKALEYRGDELIGPLADEGTARKSD